MTIHQERSWYRTVPIQLDVALCPTALSQAQFLTPSAVSVDAPAPEPAFGPAFAPMYGPAPAPGPAPGPHSDLSAQAGAPAPSLAGARGRRLLSEASDAHVAGMQLTRRLRQHLLQPIEQDSAVSLCHVQRHLLV